MFLKRLRIKSQTSEWRHSFEKFDIIKASFHTLLSLDTCLCTSGLAGCDRRLGGGTGKSVGLFGVDPGGGFCWCPTLWPLGVGMGGALDRLPVQDAEDADFSFSVSSSTGATLMPIEFRILEAGPGNPAWAFSDSSMFFTVFTSILTGLKSSSSSSTFRFLPFLAPDEVGCVIK